MVLSRDDRREAQDQGSKNRSETTHNVEDSGSHGLQERMSEVCEAEGLVEVQFSSESRGNIRNYMIKADEDFEDSGSDEFVDSSRDGRLWDVDRDEENPEEQRSSSDVER